MITQDDIIYFIVTDRFHDGNPDNNAGVDKTNPRAWHGGDFAGIIQKIPYFKALGITALWMTPVFPNTSVPEWDSFGYHGYWPLDFETVDTHLHTSLPDIPDGSREHFRRLVDTLHENGIKVILDFVANHVGYNHPVFHEDNRTPIRKEWLNEDDGSEQKRSLMGLPDLNQDHVDVADYFIRVILDWIAETGIDAIRFDAVKHVEGIFWQRVKTYVKGRYPHLYIIGEVLSHDVDTIAAYQKYHDFDTVFDFPLRHALIRVVVEGAPPAGLLSAAGGPWPGGVLDRDFRYANHNRLVTLLDNHDMEARMFTLLLRQYGGDRQAATQKYLLAMTLLFTLRGIPQIYYGDEVGLEGDADPDNRRDMPWQCFGEDGKPTGDYPEARAIFHHVSTLIHLHQTHDALRYGASHQLHADTYLYVFLREFLDSVVIVAVNNGRDPMPYPMNLPYKDSPHLATRLETLLEGRTMKDAAGNQPDIHLAGGSFNLQLGGWASAVYVFGNDRQALSAF